ncbi:MAG: HpcH/HpaI aldolase/citrate lyase family protein [Deltaproteobacteria bacterium]|nr:HpcH/HpaI aldolase/citrate lyase family protein [Deltaproteobacteria bacterium]
MAESVSAGRSAREDLVVTLEPGGHGLKVELESSVSRLYGQRIMEVVRDTLGRLGIRDCTASVKDQGALDWVIQARVEAAARRLDPKLTAEALPEPYRPLPGPVPRDRTRRSRLYLPGNQPDLMHGAALFQPDGLILDLEDAVAPAEKDAARILVRNALRAVDFGDCERMVRINQGQRGLDDLPFVLPHAVHTVLAPKAEKGADVAAVAARIRELGCGGRVWIMPIVESALGVLHAYEIASAAPEVCALAFGAEDFTRDIGAARSREGRESFVARCSIVLAARAAGVQPIDTVYGDVEDEAGLRAATEEAIALGFDGKGCIHPRQVAVVHAAYRPSDAEVVYALKVKAAIREAEAKGQGVIAIGAKMIDPPVVARALRVIKQAATYGIDAEGLEAAARTSAAAAAADQGAGGGEEG